MAVPVKKCALSVPNSLNSASSPKLPHTPTNELPKYLSATSIAAVPVMVDSAIPRKSSFPCWMPSPDVDVGKMSKRDE
jgi:hypothetical protein